MKITRIWIRNFKSIRDMEILDIENALIFVGKNNTGKTAALEAIRAALGHYSVCLDDFFENYPNIEITMTLEMTDRDLEIFHRQGKISQYKRFCTWKRDVQKKLPSYQMGNLTFTWIMNREGKIRYFDGYKKDNPYIKEILPQIFHIDVGRNLEQFQGELLMMQEDELLKRMRSKTCMFDQAKLCNHCFSCIGLIDQKRPQDMNVLEAAKLLDYKLYQLNLDSFSKNVNETFRRNGGQNEIVYSMDHDMDRMLQVTAQLYNPRQNSMKPIENIGKGMRMIYMLSLLETYARERMRFPAVVLIEEPEIFLHPQMQKRSGEILYRISQNMQVIFSTHSPNLLPNFNSRQIRQMVLQEDGYSAVCEKTDISRILDDLGYTANDLMNVDFVFIVEGKQDKSRLPLLIRHYYSEIYDLEGRLSRIAIITTNSCTNIKTYANLKYINQIYLKDQFLMIRDGDGKDRTALKDQLCRYYEDRGMEDVDKLPRVTEKNVLILKYYSFENYFLNPSVMEKLGIVSSQEEFYERLLQKWKEYLHRLTSGKHLREVLGKDLETAEDIKDHMEEIRIYLRGHNLYDIFYGPYRDRENEILEEYIRIASREDFKDILDTIDQFIYFESRKKQEYH